MVDMKKTEETLDQTLESLKLLGIKRKDGKELTREDAAQVMGLMASSFGGMGQIMQEAFARLQFVFVDFSAKCAEASLIMEDGGNHLKELFDKHSAGR